MQRVNALLSVGVTVLATGALCVRGVGSAESRRAAAFAACMSEPSSASMTDERRRERAGDCLRQHPYRARLEYVQLAGWALYAAGLAIIGLGALVSRCASRRPPVR